MSKDWFSFNEIWQFSGVGCETVTVISDSKCELSENSVY